MRNIEAKRAVRDIQRVYINGKKERLVNYGFTWKPKKLGIMTASLLQRAGIRPPREF